jgi:hypothetical protein
MPLSSIPKRVLKKAPPQGKNVYSAQKITTEMTKPEVV